jgi:hypothetical protein
LRSTSPALLRKKMANRASRCLDMGGTN